MPDILATTNKAPRRAVDGVLLLDKPAGITSNAALQKAKRLLNARKAGHTGTLDPFADGLLPLCFGEATKFSAYLLDADKRYRAVLQLGIVTTTGDPEGDIFATRTVSVDRAAVETVLPRFLGEIEQIPPMHSALKHQGKPLYEYARAGIDIARPPRKIRIHAIDLIECAPPRLVLDVRCGAGTYIRTLAQDIGQALGCGAHLTALTRLAAGGFSLTQAHTLAAFETCPDETRDGWLLPADCLISHLPAVSLGPDAAAYLHQGRSVVLDASCAGLVRAYVGSRFIGLADADGQQLVPRRLTASPQA